MPPLDPAEDPAGSRRSSAEHWESQARNWAAWTRGTQPDAYPLYAPRFLAFLPPPHGPVLEVGCGEGRVCRHLRAAGYDPIGIDAAPTLVDLAREADPSGTYLVADAAALPFDDRRFRLVVAYNSLMDVDDMPAAIREIARVLEPGGRLAACVTHPFADAGTFAGPEADAPFVVSASYLERRAFADDAERNGVTMQFRGWAYPLEAYVRAFEDAGLLVEALREPAMVEGREPVTAAEARWSRIPNFLFVRALRSA
jgi:SAM-dependent methyltransferase